jgi:hypothetical protein
MAKLPNITVDDSSIPNRIVIDFLEGTLRKKDAIAFARGFIEHHFDSLTASGYYVMPYEQGYIFEAQEGGTQRSYLPGIMKALDEDPACSACVQMARRIMEVKRSQSGTYTAVLLPEGTESQNEDIVFPPVGPKLIPFQRSGMTVLVLGLSIVGASSVILVLAFLYWLIEVSGLMTPTLRAINLSSLPLTQWQSLENAGGEKSDSYVKTLKYQNNSWQEDKATRQPFTQSSNTAPTQPQPDLTGLPPGIQPLPGHAPSAPGALPGAGTTLPAPGSMPAPSQPASANPATSLPLAANPLPAPPSLTPPAGAPVAKPPVTPAH